MSPERVLTTVLQGLPEPLLAQFHLKNSAPAARRWARRKQDEGKVVAYRVMVHDALPRVAKPLVDWMPGRENGDDINFAGVAYRLQTRRFGGVRPVMFLTAEKPLNELYGGWCGLGKPIRSVDADHEFTKALVFYALSGEAQLRWVSEEQLKAEGWDETRPDALLRGGAGAADVWVEIGGSSYTKAKLIERHRTWKQHPYQIW